MVDQKFSYASIFGKDHLSQRWQSFTFIGPTIFFSEKKSWFLNNLSLDRIEFLLKEITSPVKDPNGLILEGSNQIILKFNFNSKLRDQNYLRRLAALLGKGHYWINQEAVLLDNVRTNKYVPFPAS